MAAFGHGLRHLAFFEVLAGAEEDSAEWHATTAGLVVMRLVDAWLEEGTEVTAPGTWGVHAVREAIQKVPATDPVRSILGGIVSAMQAEQSVEMSIVAPRLMAYARALDFAGRWALAMDVYHSVIAHIHPLEDSDVAIAANMRLAYCARMLGDWSTASGGYERAGRLADASGDIMGVLKARIGDAKLALARGNLPKADAILTETIWRAGDHRLTEVRAKALHDQATVAHARGDFERAVRLAYDALGGLDSAAARDRALADLAVFFTELGVRSAARDAHLVLAATAQEQYSRWMSMVNLLEIARLDRCEPMFEQYRRELATASLPPRIAALFELYVGRGLYAFGQARPAVDALQRAIALATKHQFNQLLFEAEESLQGIDRYADTVPPICESVVPAVQEVAEAIRDMRVKVGAVR